MKSMRANSPASRRNRNPSPNFAQKTQLIHKYERNKKNEHSRDQIKQELPHLNNSFRLRNGRVRAGMTHSSHNHISPAHISWQVAHPWGAGDVTILISSRVLIGWDSGSIERACPSGDQWRSWSSWNFSVFCDSRELWREIFAASRSDGV